MELVRLKEGEKSCSECEKVVRDEWSEKLMEESLANEKCSKDGESVMSLFVICERNYTELNLKNVVCERDLSNLAALYRESVTLVGKYVSNETLYEKDLFDSAQKLTECSKERESLETTHRVRLEEMSVDFRLVGEARDCVLRCVSWKIWG